MSIYSKLSSLLTAANNKTGESDTTLTDAVQTLIDGYGQGGGGDYTDKTWPTGQISSDTTETWQYMFFNRTAITHVSLPQAGSIPASMFQNCTSLQSVYLPNATFVGYAANQFNGCSSLEGIVLPKQTGVYNNAFANCTAMIYADIMATGFHQPNVFTGCTKLATVVLRHTSVPTLNNINDFNATPFASGGTGGTLYVPSSLKSAYQSATNWSTILGYANNSIQAIEGSYYETHYADGTVIPT